jgi:hypothetical protein
MRNSSLITYTSNLSQPSLTSRSHFPTSSVDFNAESKLNSPYKHSSRASQITYFSNSEPAGPIQGNRSVKSSRNSSQSYFDKKETDKLFERLYSEAAKKKLALEQIRALEKDKDLEECTFRPEISESHVKSVVFEGLSFEHVKEKEEFRKQQKTKIELQGCTFRPKTNSICVARNEKSFERLYSDAEIFRQKMRDKELQVKDREMDGCTFRPRVLKPCQSANGKVYENLYKKYQDTQKEKRRKEMEKLIQETDSNNFIPKLVTPRKTTDSPNVYARLYAEVQTRKQKEKKTQESLSPRKTPKKSQEAGPPRYEILFALSKSSSLRKLELQSKLLKDAGISFKPDLSKTNSPSRARSKNSK